MIQKLLSKADFEVVKERIAEVRRSDDPRAQFMIHYVDLEEPVLDFFNLVSIGKYSIQIGFNIFAKDTTEEIPSEETIKKSLIDPYPNAGEGRYGPDSPISSVTYQYSESVYEIELFQ